MRCIFVEPIRQTNKANIMKTFNFTNGKKETLKYKEVSNKEQHCYSKNELIRTFLTDNIDKHENSNLDTRFELV